MSGVGWGWLKSRGRGLYEFPCGYMNFHFHVASSVCVCGGGGVINFCFPARGVGHVLIVPIKSLKKNLTRSVFIN